MSHVVTCKIEIRNLEALARAADACGMELRIGQSTYKWYGYSAGDYPIPDGMTAEDLGKCSHAVAVRGNPGAYEIGLIGQTNGSYTLAFDFWNGGYGLIDAVGEDCSKLRARYAIEAARAEAANQGWYAEDQADGSLLIYHPDGGTLTVTAAGIDANGFTGAACSQATAPIAAAMGSQTAETRKEEFNQTRQVIRGA